MTASESKGVYQLPNGMWSYDEIIARVKTSRRKEIIVSSVADTSSSYNN